jgi:hypothetical protein
MEVVQEAVSLRAGSAAVIITLLVTVYSLLMRVSPLILVPLVLLPLILVYLLFKLTMARP